MRLEFQLLKHELLAVVKRDAYTWNKYIQYMRRKLPLEAVLEMQLCNYKCDAYDPEGCFGIACTLSQMNRLQEAKFYLQKAVDMCRGYFHRNEPDLMPLYATGWEPQ